MVLVVAITAGDDFYFVGFFSDVSVIFARLVGDSDVYNNFTFGIVVDFADLSMLLLFNLYHYQLAYS